MGARLARKAESQRLKLLLDADICTTIGVDLCEDCDPVGSFSRRCDAEAGGLCLDCKPGVGGLKCDQCLPAHYNFSESGCR